MNNRALENELRTQVQILKEHFWAEVRYRFLLRNTCCPMTSSRIIGKTLRFFRTWRSFGSALHHMSPDLHKKLDRMERAAKDLSRNLDIYDAGDRGRETTAAFRFVCKLEEVRTMIKEMPI